MAEDAERSDAAVAAYDADTDSVFMALHGNATVSDAVAVVAERDDYVCSLVAQGPCERGGERTCHCARCEPNDAVLLRLESGACANLSCAKEATGPFGSEFCADCARKKSCPTCRQRLQRSRKSCHGARLCKLPKDPETAAPHAVHVLSTLNDLGLEAVQQFPEDETMQRIALMNQDETMERIALMNQQCIALMNQQ